MTPSLRIHASAFLAIAGLATAAHAAPAEYQPGEAQSNDVFVYQFSLAAVIDLNAGGYGAMLPAMVTESGHDLQSLIQFDLAAGGLSLAEGESALLKLHVGDITASDFGANPEPGAAINPTIDFYLNTAPFTEQTKWTSRPATEAVPLASLVIGDIDQWISIDLTSAVAGWQSNPGTNFGLTIRQRSLVTREGDGKVGVLFDSSATENGPILAIVPEPAAAGMLGCAGLLFLRQRRRTV